MVTTPTKKKKSLSVMESTTTTKNGGGGGEVTNGGGGGGRSSLMASAGGGGDNSETTSSKSSSTTSALNHDAESSSNNTKEIEMRPLVTTTESSEEFDELIPPSGSHHDSDLQRPSPSKSPSSKNIGGHHGVGNPGTASPTQVAINIFISFVGAGLLGMPHAFAKSGYVLGICALVGVSSANLYAMLLLVSCRRRLEDVGGGSGGNKVQIDGYGDLGRAISGERGGQIVNLFLVISQVGFATAYIIFIAENIHTIAHVDRSYVAFGCAPLLAILVQVREMKTLSPFSLLADVANLTGLSAVLFQDYEAYEYHHESIVRVDWSGFFYVTAISLYSLEGVNLILPLESSCKDRSWFPGLLKGMIFGLTCLYCLFGSCGYVAFGGGTLAPITLNLEGGWANFVQLALCLALYLTYPIMMFPVNEVIEDVFLSDKCSKPNRLFRTCVVILTALVAWLVPDFGKFLSLVGSSICTILGFILPCYFHLKVFGWEELKLYELILDVSLIVFGCIFGIIGTYTSFMELFVVEEDGGGGEGSLVVDDGGGAP